MLKYNPGGAFTAGVQLHEQQLARIMRQSLSPRQIELNRYWAFYFTEQYDARTVTWDGRKAISDVERESIARTQVLPPGFWDPSGLLDDMPLSMRKPTAPYHLVRVVVNRFTGLLFGAKKHPSIEVKHTPEVQSWIEAIVKSSRLWIRFAYARTLGGAMGAVAVTFRFSNGKPVVEVHDPRWCTPRFRDRSTGELSALEIRYMYPMEEPDEDGIIREVWYWYRRIIDENSDVRFAPAPVGEGDEPEWVEEERVDHKLGEFPGVWIRNSQTENVDGEPDCHGEFDTQEAIDRLISQADQGAVENCDPTLWLSSNELKLAELKKGSRNAIKGELGANAEYLEMSGSGVEAALKMLEVHRRNFLEVVQCILDSEKETGTMTATEIERRYSSMHDRGDMFREQYGEMGVKPMIAKIIRAALRLRKGSVDPQSGITTVGEIVLPRELGPNGETIERKLPPIETITEDEIELTWPEWVQRGPTDATAAANAVSTARTAQALDIESAVQFLAPFFGIADPGKVVQALQTEGGALDRAMTADLIGRQTAAPQEAAPAPAPPPQKAQDITLSGAQIQQAVEICVKAATGELAPLAAKNMLIAFFGFADEVATGMVIAQERQNAQAVAAANSGAPGGFGGGPPAPPGAPPTTPPPAG